MNMLIEDVSQILSYIGYLTFKWKDLLQGENKDKYVILMTEIDSVLLLIQHSLFLSNVVILGSPSRLKKKS